MDFTKLSLSCREIEFDLDNKTYWWRRYSNWKSVVKCCSADVDTSTVIVLQMSFCFGIIERWMSNVMCTHNEHNDGWWQDTSSFSDRKTLDHYVFLVCVDDYVFLNYNDKLRPISCQKCQRVLHEYIWQWVMWHSHRNFNIIFSSLITVVTDNSPKTMRSIWAANNFLWWTLM